MKLLAISALFILSSASAFADFGLIECGSRSNDGKIRLSFEEVSDINVDSSGLELDGKSVKISSLNVSRTQYGVLGINVQVGSGPGKYNYYFKNLGSSKCFGVYRSNQKGSAYVEVINSMGLVGRLNCKCDID